MDNEGSVAERLYAFINTKNDRENNGQRAASTSNWRPETLCLSDCQGSLVYSRPFHKPNARSFLHTSNVYRTRTSLAQNQEPPDFSRFGINVKREFESLNSRQEK